MEVSMTKNVIEKFKPSLVSRAMGDSSQALLSYLGEQLYSGHGIILHIVGDLPSTAPDFAKGILKSTKQWMPLASSTPIISIHTNPDIPKPSQSHLIHAIKNDNPVATIRGIAYPIDIMFIDSGISENIRSALMQSQISNIVCGGVMICRGDVLGGLPPMGFETVRTIDGLAVSVRVERNPAREVYSVKDSGAKGDVVPGPIARFASVTSAGEI